MTVKELIEELSKLNPNLRVFTVGYEGGYKDVKTISETEEFALNVHSEWYYGPHELTKHKREVVDKSKFKIVNGVIL